MNPARWYNLTAVTWAFASACLAVTQTDAPGNPPQNGQHEVRLAPLPGFANDAALLASVTSRVAELQLQAGEAADATRKAGFLLAAANLILAEQLEPPCSGKFLQLDKPQHGDDALVAAAALDRADALLIEAESFLLTEQKDSVDENPPPTDQAKNLSRIVVTHPTNRISIEQQKEAAKLGAFLEYCFVGTLEFAGAGYAFAEP